MKYYTGLMLLMAAVLISACGGKDDPIAQDNFTLTFRALYDGQLLEKYKNYPYGGKALQFNKFNIYLSDITLLKGGEELKLSDIEQVDFTPDLAPDNKAVQVSFKYSVPNGAFDGIRIGYGVKPDLNAKEPSDFGPEHPLYLQSEYWSGWKSYIFAKVQGEVDLDGNGDTETTLFYHCGSNEVYNTAVISGHIHVAGESSLSIEFDLKKWFTFDGQLLDLDDPANRTTSHSADNIVLGKKMMNNFKNAVALK